MLSKGKAFRPGFHCWVLCRRRLGRMPWGKVFARIAGIRTHEICTMYTMTIMYYNYTGYVFQYVFILHYMTIMCIYIYIYIHNNIAMFICTETHQILPSQPHIRWDSGLSLRWGAGQVGHGDRRVGGSALGFFHHQRWWSNGDTTGNYIILYHGDTFGEISFLRLFFFATSEWRWIEGITIPMWPPFRLAHYELLFKIRDGDIPYHTYVGYAKYARINHFYIVAGSRPVGSSSP
jgi:hypothetical protein